MMPINPSQLEKIMKSMGIKTEEIEAEEVIIKGKNKTIKILSPSVIKIEGKGHVSFQITGTVEEENSEEIKLLMEKTGKSEEEVKEALKKSNGDLIKAIMILKGDQDGSI